MYPGDFFFKYRQVLKLTNHVNGSLRVRFSAELLSASDTSGCHFFADGNSSVRGREKKKCFSTVAVGKLSYFNVSYCYTVKDALLHRGRRSSDPGP